MGKKRRRAKGSVPAVPKRPARDPANLLRQALAAHAEGRLGEAESLYRELLRRDARQFEAMHMLGMVALQRGETEQAVQLLSQAVDCNPRHVPALANLGTALMYAHRTDEALLLYERALALDPAFPAALSNRANSLQLLSRHEEAAEAFARLLDQTPRFDFALGNLFQCRRQSCDWREFSELAGRILAAMAAGQRIDRPFSFLSVSDSAALQLQCGRIYSAYLCPGNFGAGGNPGPFRHQRIRVAYVSADFRNHVVASLMAPVYEHHDTAHFDIIGVNLAPDDDNEVAERTRRAVGQFVNASRSSDAQVAALLRQLEVDIAVDLTGYTQGCRPGIFAHRAAPVQVNFLGFPGTSGAAYMDYIVADAFVVPRRLEHCYAERIARLPDCFQPHAALRNLDAAGPPPARADLGLPDSATVLCSFNNSYKLNPCCFDVWMRVMRQVQGSVLWLIGDSATVRKQLREAALARGIACERLVFAARVPYAEHLARLRHADLFLDTLPFNAGATAGDVLRAGVPVLTCSGEAFAARMAGSLLRAIGVPELSTTTPAEYEQRALELAADRDKLGELRARLIANRDAQPLFDIARYCRHLERAYLAMWQRAERGEPPVSFDVARLEA